MKMRTLNNVMWTFNIAFATTITILDLVSIYYWLIIMFFSVGVWANQIGWQRGFQAQREIDRKLYSAFERVLKREQAGEICLPNQEAFQKHFMDELKLDKYYKNLKEKEKEK